ncbi:phosphatase PAP2 family protein [Shimwellia blattae]|uniref:Phosphatidic acid phosphatase-like protein, type 2/haloperoxidase family protein n=1 Tax=Shimwellia blattae (strain ATCC 29907 / DSM 4481 / JCM 1650 / NBRC 105725 / CDC 9005-74) TaxID=630626 RepID=I2B505_SHIBC|nr:phosphatase PAP2 family protein [Shimwellia blattae]AFJ45609.1 phosphatidic acid phosphatase-like protein, type 2/haloperoxidase family protein [Shimwellia blattae DSM 4481 = NBRC 105725]GAB81451.1 putative acid phosphatase [Shimwellia blattae DSM 4481 = NBRC 105725]VDY63091.1 PAP2 superfamily [Shimwellia blattae]VEC20284.1 PAP2 superfamily [Shimwellia blattae]
MSWSSVTFLGDSTLLLPSAALLFVAALFSSRRQVAWQWALAFGVTGAIVCSSKLAFMGWGIGIRALDFTGFSGHTALSACFWPVFLWLVCSRLLPRFRHLGAVLGYGVAATVGISRLMIHVHSPAEVVAGFALGCTASAAFLLWQRRVSLALLSGLGLAAALVVPMVILTTGSKAPTQSLLENIAVQLSSKARPYIRDDLHNGRISLGVLRFNQ